VEFEPGESAGWTAGRVVDLRSEPQCERSWKRDGTVRQRSDGSRLSDRDAAAIGVA
jgi:isoleucyl-tRNA synthetase